MTQAPPHPKDAPRPDRGWSHTVEVLHSPVIVPPDTRAFSQPAGILRRDGSYCAQGALWRKARPLTTKPARPDGAIREMEGSWMWGGVLWGHFGHFLVESTGRLWALASLPEEVKGVLFMRKDPSYGNRLDPYQKDFMRLSGVSKARVLNAPARPEKLYVPGQAFGLGPLAQGTPLARAWFRAHFARDVAPDGPEKLYISRSGLGAGRAKLLCEDRLDRYLESEGYTVFHPQKHDMRTQIARYKAAKQVIACEGSAIHLFAMVARPPQQLAIVVRRMSEATEYIARHVASFGQLQPLVVDALSAGWLPKGEVRRRRQISALDFPATQAKLVAGGFVSAGAVWDQPSPNEIEAALAASSKEPLVQIAL